MTPNEPIKHFCAVTYDNKIYHFIITDENKIYCCEFRLEYGADILELKPNFVLRDKEYQTIYSLKEYLKEFPREQKEKDYKKYILGPIPKEEMAKQQQNLISCYIIEPKVLEHLIENQMIMYSHDMALLYHLDPQYAYDKFYQKRSFKKNRSKKAKILTKQKMGIFR